MKPQRANNNHVTRTLPAKVGLYGTSLMKTTTVAAARPPASASRHGGLVRSRRASSVGQGEARKTAALEEVLQAAVDEVARAGSADRVLAPPPPRTFAGTASVFVARGPAAPGPAGAALERASTSFEEARAARGGVTVVDV